MTKKIRKYFEMTDNESTVYKNLWGIVKRCLKGKL